jgi:NTE family protein
MRKRKNIGLALGGGAVFGAAHVGVLRAIEEKNIDISYISGTSIGALVAALWAFGIGWEKIAGLAKDTKWLDISSVSLSKCGILSNRGIRKLINENIGDSTFEDAKIPLAMIATDISNGEKVVLRKGNVADAVMASACIPGVFIPVEINDRLLVDGGIVENIPLSPLEEMGAKYIIGVDLNSNHQYQKPKNIIEVMLNSFHFTLKAAAKLQTEEADLLLQPDLSGYNRIDLDQVDNLIDIGYKLAMEKL